MIGLNEEHVAHKIPFGHTVSGVARTSNNKTVLSYQLFVLSSSERNYWENNFSIHCRST